MEQSPSPAESLFKKAKHFWERKQPILPKGEFELPKPSEARRLKTQDQETEGLVIQRGAGGILLINPTANPDGEHACLKLPSGQEEVLSPNHKYATQLGLDKLPPQSHIRISSSETVKTLNVNTKILKASLSTSQKEEYIDPNKLKFLDLQSIEAPEALKIIHKSTEALSPPEAVDFHVSRYNPITKSKESVSMPVSPSFRTAVLEHRKILPSSEVILPSMIFNKLPSPDAGGNISLLGETLTVDSIRDSLHGVGKFNRFSLDRFDSQTGLTHKVYYLPIAASSTGNTVLVPLTLEGYGQVRDEILKPKLIAGERLFVPKDFGKERRPHTIDGTVKEVFLEESQGKVVLKNKDGTESTYLVSACTTEGTRYLNEDAVQAIVFQLPDGTQGLSVSVKDGMGGHSAGEKASEVACKASEAYLHSLEKLGPEWADFQKKAQALQKKHNIDLEQARGQVLSQQIITVENAAVYKYNKDNSIDSGATRTGVIIMENQEYTGNLGDSRTSIISPAGQHLSTTKDHSLVERLLAVGQITPEEAVDYPQGNVIYRVLGDKLTVDTEIEGLDKGPAVVSMAPVPLGTTIAITCDGIPDGLKEVTPGEKVTQIVNASQNIQEAAQQLVIKASPLSGDNDTAVVIKRVR
jgi:serine/threonine protein phosphatase PrpC